MKLGICIQDYHQGVECITGTSVHIETGLTAVVLVKSTPCGDHCMHIFNATVSAQLPQFYVLTAGKQEPMAEAADDAFMQN